MAQWLILGLPVQWLRVQSWPGSLDPTCLEAKRPEHKAEAVL